MAFNKKEKKQPTTAVCRNGGFWALFKVGFVLAKSVFNRKFRLP
jgi:hypothetical protein